MTFNGTIVQALLMMNGKELNDNIKRPDGLVAKVIARGMKRSDRDQYIIEEIYLTALGRKPGTQPIDIESIDPKTKKKSVTKMAENQFVHAQLERARKEGLMPDPKSKGKNNGPPPKGDAVYQAFFEDLFWTLLNTNEFMLNH
jgi:hypothetical protein